VTSQFIMFSLFQTPRFAATPLCDLAKAYPLMDIPNPRRILAVGAPESGVLSLLQGNPKRYATLRQLFYANASTL
jgi:hypothetical protein